MLIQYSADDNLQI